MIESYDYKQILIVKKNKKTIQPAVRASACCLPAKKNVGKIWESVRGEYRLSTDFGARRHDVALVSAGGTFDAFWLRIRPRILRVTRVPSTANVRTTHGLRESFKFLQRSLAPRTEHVRAVHVISAWSMLTRHFPSSAVQ